MTVSPTANRAAAGRAGWVLVVAARVGVVVPARRGRHTFRLHSELFCRAKRLVGWSVGRLVGCSGVTAVGWSGLTARGVRPTKSSRTPSVR